MTVNIFGVQMEIKKDVIAVMLTVLIFLAGMAGYLIIKSDKDIIIDSQSREIDSSAKNTNTTDAKSEPAKTNPDKNDEKKIEEIKIYVVGCVNKPGIVTIEKGQLIDDAVKLAGGFSKDADPDFINLVYKLDENLMLYIKSKKEMQQNSQSTVGAGEAGKGVKLIKDSGGVVVNETQSTNALNGKVNINKATASELDTLPGIGEATARDIISYRENNGLFKTIQDIMKVPRIKVSRFASIKDFITVN